MLATADATFKTNLSELLGLTGLPALLWWQHQHTCHWEGWLSTETEYKRKGHHKKMAEPDWMDQSLAIIHQAWAPTWPLTSSSTMPTSWTSVMFLKIFKVFLSVPSSSSTSPETRKGNVELSGAVKSKTTACSSYSKSACVHIRVSQKPHRSGSSNGRRAASKVLWRGWPGTVSLCSWPAPCTLQDTSGHYV